MQTSFRSWSFAAFGWLGVWLVLLTVTARGAVFTWDGGSLLDSSLGAAENWVGDTAPDFPVLLMGLDDLVFTGAVRTDPQTTGVGPSCQTVAFDSGASAFTIGGSDTLTINGLANAIVNNSIATQTFSAKVSLVGPGSTRTDIRATSESIVFNDLEISTYGARFFGVGNTVTINGNLITGFAGGSLNVGTATAGDDFANAATVVLAADNSTTFTQRMGVNGNGVLRLTATGAAGSTDNSTATALIIQGGTTNSGVVELVGGITIDKRIECYLRSGDVKDAAHIRSNGDNTLDGRIYLNQAGSTYVNIDSESGLLTLPGEIYQNLTGTRLVRFRGAGNFAVNGSVAGSTETRSWKVAKLGDGTLSFDNSDSGNGDIAYTGDTAIFDGTLQLLGTTLEGKNGLEGSPTIFVADGAVFNVTATGFTLGVTQALRGGGSVVGNVGAVSGGTLAPGGTVDETVTTYTDGAGILSVTGNLDMSAGANMIWNLGALSESNPGTDFDVLAVSGALTLGGTSQLTLDFSVLEEALRPDAATPNAFWGNDRSWKIVDVNDSTGSLTGDFATLTNGTFTGVGTFATRVSGNDVYLDFDSSYTPVPQIPGDTDGNGSVDELDARKLAENWGANVGLGGFASGDFNGDQVVNAADAAILAANWGDHTAAAEAAGVPEPGMIVLLLGLAVAALSRRIGR